MGGNQGGDLRYKNLYTHSKHIFQIFQNFPKNSNTDKVNSEYYYIIILYINITIILL